MSTSGAQHVRPQFKHHHRPRKPAAAPPPPTPLATSHVRTQVRENTTASMTKMPDGTDAALFSSLSGRLHPTLLQAMSKNGFHQMSPVQDLVLRGLKNYRDDCLVQAKTGTGKTIAFLLPAIDALLRDPPSGGYVGVLVISPTRELATQIAKECERIVNELSPRPQCHTLTGGTNKSSSLTKLRMGKPAIVVGTPGRLEDVLGDPAIREQFSRIKTLILDEADTMLDQQGHLPNVKAVLKYLPPKSVGRWQGMCFSATVPAKVKQVIDVALSPGYTTISAMNENEEPTHATIPQFSVQIDGIENMFTGILALLRHEMQQAKKIIVFSSTAYMAGLWYEVFGLIFGNTVPVYQLQSRMSQPARTKMATNYKSAHSGILFASDVVGRGLDFPDVDLVIQVGPPKPKEQYIHRVGRTGRAGKSGRAVIILDELAASWPSRNRDLPIKPVPSDLAAALAAAATGQDAHAEMARAFARVDPKSKTRAYKAFVGGASTAEVGVKALGGKQGVVQTANRLALQGMHTRGVPGVSKKFVGRAGFKGVPALNIVADEDLED